MHHGSRLLIYSHDSFGLGHLRRCRAIAHHLVERLQAPVGADPVRLADHRQLRLPLPGRLRARARRDQAAERRLHLAEPSSRHRQDAGDPPLDHPPHRRGLRPGRVPGRQGAAGPARRGALHARDAEARAARAASSACATSWTSRRASSTSGSARWCSRRWSELYDEIWVYGLPEVFDPLREIPGMGPLDGQGAVHRLSAAHGARGSPASMPDHRVPEREFILVTPGGGGDGAELIDWVIGAYEARSRAARTRRCC